MRIQVVRSSQNNYQQKRRRTWLHFPPKWYVIGGIGLTVFSVIAYFVAQIIFITLGIVGLIIIIWGIIQWILQFLRTEL